MPTPPTSPSTRAPRRLPVLLAWALVGLFGLGAATQIFDRLSSSLDPAAHTESERLERRLTELTGQGGQLAAVIAGDPTDPAVAGALAATSDRLRSFDGVAGVVDATSGLGTLTATDGQASVLAVFLQPDLGDDAEDTLVADLTGELRERHPEAAVAGNVTIDAELGDTAESDLIRAELLALPIVLLLLGLAVRSARGALLGLALVLATVTGALGLLFLLSLVTDVSVFAVNVVTMFGIGLAVDYGLLVIGRFRGARGDGLTVPAAAAAARATAGRTVAWSGLTVTAALAGLVAFREPVLRSLAYGGIGATVVAILAANTLLPALLARLGHRIPASPTATSAGGAFHRVAAAIQRRPAGVLAAGLSLLAVFALPAASVRLEGLDARSLPEHSQARIVSDQIAQRFPGLRAEPIQIRLDPSPGAVELDGYQQALRTLAGTDDVRSSPLPDGSTLVEVVPTGTSADREARDLVRAIRALPAPSPALVGGEAAEDVDFVTSLRSRLPAAAGAVVLATFCLLWALTGSMLIPLKAIVLTVASLAASLGALTWVFQEGHGAGLVGVDPIGGLHPVILLLTAVFAFGLSTDYEVFLLGAVLEERHAGADTDAAVRSGLQRTGRTITTAALLILLVFIGFGTGELLLVKQLGIGLAIAVVLDATLVRLVLVPAAMTLAGRANWWAPPLLRRLHDRLQLRHAA